MKFSLRMILRKVSDTQIIASLRSPVVMRACHPERVFYAKDLPTGMAFSQEILRVKTHQIDAFSAATRLHNDDFNSSTLNLNHP